MDQSRRQLLQRQWVNLLENIEEYDGIVDGLHSYGILTKSMKERVNEKKGSHRLREILDILPKRGPQAFNVFIQVLIDCKEYEAVRLLCPEREKEMLSLMNQVLPGVQESSAMHMVPQNDELPEKWPDNEMHTPIRVEVVNTPQPSPIKHIFDLAAKGDGTAYPMSKPCRGIFLLISNQFFKNARESKINLSDRDGTDVDRHALTSLFEQLRFHVIERIDRTGKEILKDVKEVSEMDHTYYDCFACSILTHGKRDGVFGVDGESIHLDSLKDAVCASPSLVGKPKLFFIQACQGENRDSGMGVEGGITYPEEKKVSPLEELGIKEKQKEADKMAGSDQKDGTTTDAASEGRVSTKADVFVAMATVPDFVSWRNTNWGTWFIQAVVYIFAKFAHKHHLVDMMTYVHKLVSRAETKKGFKQVSVYASSLTGSLYFFPGLKIDCPQPQRMVESHSEVDICEKNKTNAPSANNKLDAQDVNQVASMIQSASIQPSLESRASVPVQDDSFFSSGPIAQVSDDVDGRNSMLVA